MHLNSAVLVLIEEGAEKVSNAAWLLLKILRVYSRCGGSFYMRYGAFECDCSMQNLAGHAFFLVGIVLVLLLCLAVSSHSKHCCANIYCQQETNRIKQFKGPPLVPLYLSETSAFTINPPFPSGL